jgi:8-oxo-dGTP pyrophosphatase MutT (NUDIX family)
MGELEKKKAAGCVIVNNNSILLLHRIDKDWWEIPGGKMHPGESIEETAKREAREELDCDIEIIKELGKTQFSNFQFNLDYTWFLCKVSDGALAKVGEVQSYDELKSIPIDQLRNYKLSPSISNFLTAFEKGEIVL